MTKFKNFYIIVLTYLKNNWIPILFSTIGFLIIMINNYNRGVGTSPDSINYLNSARSIIENPSFLLFDNYALVIWPPGYPLTLSFFGFVTNLDPYIISNYLSAIFFSIFLFSIYIQVFRLSNSKFLTIIILTIIITTVRVVHLFSMAWSEPLFIALISVAMIFLINYLEKQQTKDLIIFSFLVMLTCMTKYIGVSFFTFGLISIYIFKKKTKPRSFKHIIIYITISLIPLALWLIRNYLLTNTIAGYRPSGLVPLEKNILATIIQFKKMVFTFGELETILKTLVFIIFNLFAMLLVWRKLKFTNFKINDEISFLSIKANFIWIISYLSFLIYLQTYVETINYRHLMPIFFNLILFYFSLIILMRNYLTRYDYLKFSKFIVVLSIFIFIPFIFFNSKNNYQSIMYFLNNKVGSGRVYLKTMDYFNNNKHPNFKPLYSNNTSMTKFYTNYSSEPLSKLNESLDTLNSFYIMLANRKNNNIEFKLLTQIQDNYKIDTIVTLEDVVLLNFKNKLLIE